MVDLKKVMEESKKNQPKVERALVELGVITGLPPERKTPSYLKGGKLDLNALLEEDRRAAPKVRDALMRLERIAKNPFERPSNSQ